MTRFALWLALALLPAAALAIPPGFNVQARLTDSNGVNRDGVFSLKFSLFDAAAGGNLLWSRTYPSITVRNGNFQLVLQDPADNPLQALAGSFSADSRYLEIQVLSGPGLSGPEAPLVPRQQLVSVPFSFTAGALTSPNAPITASIGSYERLRVDVNGNVGVGTSAPGAALDVAGNIQSSAGSSILFSAGPFASGLGSELGNSLVNFGINDGRFGASVASSQGGFYRADSRPTAAPLQMWVRPANGSLSEVLEAQANSNVILAPGAGAVGVGTLNPTAGTKLDVAGSLRVADGTQGAGKVLTSDANGVASWQSGTALGSDVLVQSAVLNGVTSFTFNNLSPGVTYKLRMWLQASGPFNTGNYIALRFNGDGSSVDYSDGYNTDSTNGQIYYDWHSGTQPHIRMNFYAGGFGSDFRGEASFITAFRTPNRVQVRFSTDYTNNSDTVYQTSTGGGYWVSPGRFGFGQLNSVTLLSTNTQFTLGPVQLYGNVYLFKVVGYQD